MRRWAVAGIVLSLVAVAGLAILIATAARAVRRSSSETRQNAAQLRNEFESIEPLPGATELGRHDASKLGQALVGATYTTTAAYDDIRQHYDRVARQHGWDVGCEQPLRDWARDFGGRAREYRKGQFRASVQFAGERAQYGWNYAFDMTWGLRGDCR